MKFLSIVFLFAVGSLFSGERLSLQLDSNDLISQKNNSISQKIVFLENAWMKGYSLSSETNAVSFKNSVKSAWIIETNKHNESIIKTEKKPYRYLYIEKKSLKLGNEDQKHKWKLIDHSGYSKIQSISKPKLFIHVENKKLQVSPAQDHWHSTRWILKEKTPKTTKTVFLESAWRKGYSLSFENNTVTYKNTAKNAWIIETNEYNESIIKTEKKPYKYLYTEDNLLKLGNEDQNHKWKLIDFGGYLKIQNISNPKLFIHIENNKLEASPASGHWHSTRWTLKEKIPQLTLRDLLCQKENLFTITVDEFEKKWAKLFGAVWTDKYRSSARSTEKATFLEAFSKETIFKFRQNKLSGVTMLFYNKGDHGNFRERKFKEYLSFVVNTCTSFFGEKPKFKPNAGITKNYLYYWLKIPYLYKLEYSFLKTKQEFIGEYIKLSVVPGNSKINAVNVDQVSSSNLLTNAELKEKVIRENDGSVFLAGVPMVDQGDKGYCACAATARVLNYYGREIDQHDIAKIAQTTNGTSLPLLKKAIASISAKFRLNFTSIVKCYLSSDNDHKRLLNKLKYAYKRHDFDFNSSLKLNELKIILNEMAMNDKRFNDFQRGIKRSIDNGRPIVWTLLLGLIPEPEIPQTLGWHMRLIIGYNDLTDEVYYSDSWGKGHEKKAMDMAAAFYASYAIWEIRPR